MMAKADTPKSDLKALSELHISRGWALISDAIRDNILEASLALSDPKLSGLQATIDFQRGMIHALSKIPTLVEMRIARLEQEIAYEAALEKSKHTTLKE